MDRKVKVGPSMWTVKVLVSVLKMTTRPRTCVAGLKTSLGRESKRDSDGVELLFSIGWIFILSLASERT